MGKFGRGGNWGKMHYSYNLKTKIFQKNYNLAMSSTCNLEFPRFTRPVLYHDNLAPVSQVPCYRLMSPCTALCPFLIICSFFFSFKLAWHYQDSFGFASILYFNKRMYNSFQYIGNLAEVEIELVLNI